MSAFAMSLREVFMRVVLLVLVSVLLMACAAQQKLKYGMPESMWNQFTPEQQAQLVRQDKTSGKLTEADMFQLSPKVDGTHVK